MYRQIDENSRFKSSVEKIHMEQHKNFTHGLKLCEQFYWEAVRPILDRHFPDLPHSAAILGTGSEVLGFDDEMSTDHHWGPRVTLFLEPQAYQQQQDGDIIYDRLAQELPYGFMGYSTNFSEPNPDDNGTQLLQFVEEGPVNHRVYCQTVDGFFAEYLNFNVDEPILAADWLTFPQQRLRTIRHGAIYHDGIGLHNVRTRFDYYPHDVWLYLLAASWARIGQEEHLMGRAGLVEDEIGSALIGARLVRDMMQLAFLMERAYAPYPKWFGTAFQQLNCADVLTPHLEQALWVRCWKEREKSLVLAYETIASMHNKLQLTKPLPETATQFHGRPFQAIAIHGFCDALLEQIENPAVQKIAQQRPIGSIDQFSDSTDMLEDLSRRPTLRQLF